jgi:hypothetical protein
LKLTRRFPVAMTEDGYRRLKRFAADSKLEEGEALSFLFENFNSVINEDTFGQRLRMFQNELEARKR